MRVSFGRQSDRRRGTEGHSSATVIGLKDFWYSCCPWPGLAPAEAGHAETTGGIDEERFGDLGGAEPLVRPVGGPEGTAIFPNCGVFRSTSRSEAVGFDSE